MASSRTVVIAGAGIGGLTAALAIARHGYRVVVLEQAERLEETGAGIQLSPNASRVLIGLGLRERLAPHVATPQELIGGECAQRARARARAARRCRRATLWRALLDHPSRRSAVRLAGGGGRPIPTSCCAWAPGSTTSPSTATASRWRPIRGARPSRSAAWRWSAPTEHGRDCAAVSATTRRRASPATPPGARWCPPKRWCAN